jgi:23S rRNA (guanosine2251-2'-O)-methyltransferase
MSTKKPSWIIAKEREIKKNQSKTIWLFGLHAVRDALNNPLREKLQLVITRNAAEKLKLDLDSSNVEMKISDPRKFSAPIDPQSVHQGVALEVKPLDWGEVSKTCWPLDNTARVIALDRVTDPHNVGAILRSAEVFGAQAVISPIRYAAPETGALAKTASGALETQPYLRVKNLSTTLGKLKEMGYFILGMDAEAKTDLSNLPTVKEGPLVIVLGAEGPGLRQKTKECCDLLVKIPSSKKFGSLNVSNAAAVALYSTTTNI